MKRRLNNRPVRDEHTAQQAKKHPAWNKAMRRGARLYRQFYRFAPRRIVQHSHPRMIPPVMVELGELVGLIYRTDKWQPGRPRTYIHFMETRPRLVSDVEGRQLYLVGGKYRVTAAGIEG